jgi:hypothetical protein
MSTLTGLLSFIEGLLRNVVALARSSLFNLLSFTFRLANFEIRPLDTCAAVVSSSLRSDGLGFFEVV